MQPVTAAQTGPPPSFDAQATLLELGESTTRLLDTVRSLDDAALREPSGLPRWTRGHVVSHLCRNADGLSNLARWAATGLETPMYASREARDVDIEAGAGRGAAEQLADLESSGQRLSGLLAEHSDEADRRVLRVTSGAEVEGWEIPLLRIREVEVHHVDLAAGYAPTDWSEAFCVRTLDQVSGVFAERGTSPFATLVDDQTRTWVVGSGEASLRGPTSFLLAWLLGRHDGSELLPRGRNDVPPAPPWA